MVLKLRGLVLAACVLSGLSVVLAKPAYADTQFCNRTDTPVQIAYRSQNGTRTDNYFVTQGWLYIGQHSCKQIASGDASLFYHFISMLSLSTYSFVRLQNAQPYFYCVRATDFQYTGSPQYCTGEYFTAPFYMFSSDTPDATFYIY